MLIDKMANTTGERSFTVDVSLAPIIMLVSTKDETIKNNAQ